MSSKNFLTIQRSGTNPLSAEFSSILELSPWISDRSYRTTYRSIYSISLSRIVTHLSGLSASVRPKILQGSSQNPLIIHPSLNSYKTLVIQFFFKRRNLAKISQREHIWTQKSSHESFGKNTKRKILIEFFPLGSFLLSFWHCKVEEKTPLSSCYLLGRKKPSPLAQIQAH